MADFNDDFGELLLSDKAASHAWDIPLETYLEDYTKRLHDILSTDDGFSKMNFSEPAFIVSKAAKIWGRKVDSFDEILHTILQRTVARHRDEERASSEASGEQLNEDSNGPINAESVPKRVKQKAPGWTLEDLKTPKDIFRPIIPVEGENIGLSKTPADFEPRTTLRPRIAFDLHPVYRLPVSISIKNITGDVMGEYCDFFSNTFDVEQVSMLLTPGWTEHPTEIYDTTVNDFTEHSEVEDDALFIEPVTLDAEPLMEVCPNLATELQPDHTNAVEQQNGFIDTAFDVPKLDGTKLAFDEEVVLGNRNVRNKRAGCPVITNKFLTRLDPYDTSSVPKDSKPLPKNPGKPYKVPSQQKQKENEAAVINLPSHRSEDLFEQHMPPLKPPPQMPNDIADIVSVELAEHMLQRFNENVLVACGRKTQLQITTNRSSPLASYPTEGADNNFDPAVIEDDDNSSIGDGDVIADAGDIELPPMAIEQPVDFDGALPDVQNLEDMLPSNVYDESRIKRVQDWDRYVESRLSDIASAPFDVNRYCSKMVQLGQEAGKRKWFSLEKTALALVEDKEIVKKSPTAKLTLNVRREGARSLVSLLFLANAGNVEIKTKPENVGSEIQVRLLSDHIHHIDVDSHGIELPQRVALSAQEQA